MKDLENLLEDQLRQPIRRKARNGFLYTKNEFLDFYKEEGENMWEAAEQTEGFEWGSA